MNGERPDRAINSVAMDAKKEHPFATDLQITHLISALERAYDDWLAETQAEWKHPTREAPHPHHAAAAHPRPKRTPPTRHHQDDDAE